MRYPIVRCLDTGGKVSLSTIYTKADRARIKTRKRAIELVEADIFSTDKRLEKLFDQLAKTRREHNTDLMKNDMSKKKQDARINLFQNNILEFQHEIAELYARKRELRDELVRRGDELADYMASAQIAASGGLRWDDDFTDEIGC